MRGAKDYSNVRMEGSLYRVDDMGELAARLGCLSVYDRSGTVVWLEDFSTGMESWTKSNDGTGSSIGLSTAYPFVGAFSCKLTAGSDGGRSAIINRYLSPLVSGQIGVEMAVAFLTHFDHFVLQLAVESASLQYQASIKLSDADDKMYCAGLGATYTEFGDLPNSVMAYGLYHHLKLAVDFTTNTFMRFSFDGVNYDLTSYGVTGVSNSGIPHTRITAYLVSRTGYNDVAQVDGVILTQDEVLRT